MYQSYKLFLYSSMNNNIDLTSFISKESSSVSWKIATIATLIILLSSVIFYIYFINRVSDQLIKNNVKSFSYWAQVGDSFQLKRAQENINSVNESIQLHFSRIKNLQPIYLGFEGDWPLPNLLFFKEVALKGTDKSIIGKLRTKQNINLYLFVAFSAFIIFTLRLTSRLLLNRFEVFGNKVALPIAALAKEMDRQNYKGYSFDKTEPSLQIVEIKELKDSFHKMIKRIENQEKSILDQETIKAKEKISYQIAHDIRSPLAVIQHLEKEAQFKNQETRQLLISSIERIKEIADDLLLTKKNQTTSTTWSVNSTLRVLTREKLTEHSEMNITYFDSDSNHILPGKESEIKRALSNIINNSVEASVDGKPIITIRVQTKKNFIELLILDNGPGIPLSLHNTVLEDGFSYGKKNGNGLGLAYVQEVVRKNRGYMKLSNEKNGLAITLGFPKN